MESTAHPSERRIRSNAGSEDPSWLKWVLTATALGFVAVFLLLPLANVFVQAFARGAEFYRSALADSDTLSAIRLTLTISAVAVPLNALFGIAAAWAIAKHQFRGKTFLVALIDLPFAVSPVVAGLMFLLLFGRQGLFGEWLDSRDIQIVYAVPGMVLATVFITFPFVARELVPIMQAAGTEQEQAALTLGANGLQTFWHVTLPSIKWGLLYGVILCNARAMGEFGAVSIVSGTITGMTDTLPLRVEKLYHGATSASATAAFAVASLLAMIALLTLIVKSALEWKHARDERASLESSASEERTADRLHSPSNHPR